jgi:ABC-2 type transport system permease protein
MNTPPNAVPQSSEPIRPFYWSVRRELWEHRSIYFAPLAVAGISVIGFLISLIWLPRNVREISMMDPAMQPAMLAHPFAHVAMLLVLTGFLVGIFYSLDALHGERRDRSILFWKSMPVSDAITVLSKAVIPLVVLPLIVFTVTITLQLIMLVMSMAFLVTTGGAATMWANLPYFQMEVGLLYSLIVMALWHAPIYGWLMLVSGWAKRATFLWAILPPVALSLVEGIAFRTGHIANILLKDRLFGMADKAFNLITPDGTPVDAHFIPLSQFTPLRFLSSPGLWLGLIFAGLCFFAATRMRRYREPI